MTDGPAVGEPDQVTIEPVLIGATLVAGHPRLAPILAMPLLLLLGGCLWGGAKRSMELTMAESLAESPAEAGPIQFIWEDGNNQQTALISTTTSPTERFIAPHKIEKNRRRPPHAYRIVPPLNPNAPTPPPRREPAITLVALDGGLFIRKRAAAQTGDVLTGQQSADTPLQRLINNPPSGSRSAGNLRGGRVTVLGVTGDTILPGTTKGP